jgi:Amt family ammonium transporter
MFLPNKQLGTTIPFILYALFQMKFAVLLRQLTGALAERIRFISFYYLFACLPC